MSLPEITLAVIGAAAAAGLISAYFKASAGKSNRELLESNIEAYKDAEKLKDQRIVYLENQLYIKDETIKRLLNGTK